MDPTITDWISALSAFGAMVIAGVAAYFAYKTYLAAPIQEEEPAETNASSEVGDQHGLMFTVFDTSKQKTTLKVANGGLECDLEYKDGRTTTRENPQWRFSAQQCAHFLEYEDFSVNPGYKVRTGLFSIGPRKNWLYSKRLFGDPHDLNQMIARLLNEAAQQS